MIHFLPPLAGRQHHNKGEQMLQMIDQARLQMSQTDTEAGQGTVEYVLVILAAAAIAPVLIGWMSSDGLISSLFSSVLSKVIGFVTG